MTTASKAASSRLPDIVGAEHVSSDPAELSAYAVDGKVAVCHCPPRFNRRSHRDCKVRRSRETCPVASGARTKLGIGCHLRDTTLRST